MRSLRRRLGPRLGLHRQYSPRPLVLRLPAPPRTHSDDLPDISIVTPSFNQGRFLERTVRSVLEQGYSGLEYIVQDGGSTDETAAILGRYSSAFATCDSRKDRGQAHALNLGFSRSRGSILAYLNSDDLLLPGALAAVGSYFAEHPDVDVLYGHRIVIDEEDNEIGRWVMLPHEDRALKWNDYIPQETLFWRRRIWDAIGGCFDESFHYALDWDILLRFREAGAKFVRLPRFLGAFRIHDSQKSTLHVRTIGLQEARRLRQRVHGRSVSKWESRCRVVPYLCKHVIYDWMHRCGLAA